MFKFPSWPRCKKCGRFKIKKRRTFFGAEVRRFECPFCDDPTPPGFLRLPS